MKMHVEAFIGKTKESNNLMLFGNNNKKKTFNQFAISV